MNMQVRESGVDGEGKRVGGGRGGLEKGGGGRWERGKVRGLQ